MTMEVGNNLLSRPTLTVSPYTSPSAAVSNPSTALSNTSPQDRRSSLNGGGWGSTYGSPNEHTPTGATHHPAAAIGAYPGTLPAPPPPPAPHSVHHPSTHKPPYSSYSPLNSSSVTDFFSAAATQQNCQTAQLGALSNPLNTLSSISRNFPIYGTGPMDYAASGMHAGAAAAGIFGDIGMAGIHHRFDADPLSGYPSTLMGGDPNSGEYNVFPFF